MHWHVYLKDRQHRNNLLKDDGQKALVAIFCGHPEADKPAMEGWHYFNDVVLYEPLAKLTRGQLADRLFKAFTDASERFGESETDVRCDLILCGGGAPMHPVLSVVNIITPGKRNRPMARKMFDDMIEENVLTKAQPFLKRQV